MIVEFNNDSLDELREIIKDIIDTDFGKLTDYEVNLKCGLGNAKMFEIKVSGYCVKDQEE